MSYQGMHGYTIGMIGFGVLLAAAGTADAGPPLICHSIDIGDAKSLPWGSKPFAKVKDYDVKNLVQDTLELLASDTPILARMETLRRATIYAKADQKIALELLTALQARALDFDARSAPNALAWFDVGYIFKCYEQYEIPVMWKGGTSPGYPWTLRAQNLRPDDPQIEFALALMTKYIKPSDRKWQPHPNHSDHLKRVLKAADGDELLTRNLVRHFGKNGSLEKARGAYSDRG